MLSRVADSIYWMNRYMERAENYARFIIVNFNLELDMPPGIPEQWEPLLQATMDLDLFKQKYSSAEKDDVIDFMAFDTTNPNSIISCLMQARENARTVRENISLEMWEQINRLYLKVSDPDLDAQTLSKEPREFFKQIILGCQLFFGTSESTVSHTEGFHFGRLGRYLERADKTARILDVKYHILLPSTKRVGSPLDLLQWISLLKSASAYSMCRKHYGVIVPQNVMEFLILNRDFPKSIYFCFRQAQKSLSRISDRSQNQDYNEAEKLLGAVKSELEYTDIDDVIRFGVHEYLDNIQLKINQISDAIFDAFFVIKD